MNHYTLNFDGSCWPNPNGRGGCGYLIYRNGELIDSYNEDLGTGNHLSNNVAEYIGLNRGLEKFLQLSTTKGNLLQVKGDSQLVIKQMNKHWKIKEGLYTNYAYKAKELIAKIRKRGNQVSIDWIPRNKNEEADILSKKHLET